MIDYKKALGVATMALALVGAGCSGNTSTTVTGSTTPPKAPVAAAPVVAVPKTPVKFSAVKSDLFGLDGKYSSMTITGGTGTCITKLPYTSLTYAPSAPGKNFMLRDKGVVIDDSSSSNTGSVLFDGKTTAGASVDCKLMIPYAADTATLTCADAAGKEVCSATYTSLMAQPI